MKKKNPILTFGMLIVFFTAGCNINVDSAAESPNLELTVAFQALAIQQTQTALQNWPQPSARQWICHSNTGRIDTPKSRLVRTL